MSIFAASLADSKNGTFVNGVKIVAQSIREGDTISFGNISFKKAHKKGSLSFRRPV